MASTIILSDNGASSGSAGLKETGGNDGVLILQTTTSGGTATNAVYVDNTQNVGFGQTPTSYGSTVRNVEAYLAGGSAFTLLSAATASVKTEISAAESTLLGQVGTRTNHPLVLKTNDSEKMRILTTGAILSLSGGSTTATGTGIAFPATQSASSDANTLDDYEEGTFTPALNFGGGTTGIVYGDRQGTYIKVGKLVYVRLGFILSSKGSSTGNLQVTGLPFTSVSQSYSDPSAMFNGVNFTSLSSGITGIVGNNTTNVQMYTITSTGVAALSNSNINNTTEFYGGFCYVATA